jgi:predicted nucleic acid-binding protein
VILVDSSGWIEYLAARSKADEFARYIQADEPLVTSAIQVYEIYKVVRRDISQERAIESISALRATTVVPLDESLALEAADISLEHGLAMADSIIFATAARYGAQIVTADTDFEGLPGVTLIR